MRLPVSVTFEDLFDAIADLHEPEEFSMFSYELFLGRLLLRVIAAIGITAGIQQESIILERP